MTPSWATPTTMSSGPSVFAASRCLDTGAWHAGPPEFDAAGPDSPGISNPPCAGWLCTADITSDGAVDAMDLARLLGDWGAFGTMSDLDGDALVDARDLAILLANWGPCDL